MQNVIIKADASETIGFGHVKRCLTLARAFRGDNFYVRFSGENQLTKQLVEQAGFPFIHIDDTDDFLSLLIDEKVSVVIVDTYEITASYLQNIKTLVPILAYVDDLCAFDYPVDIVINGNINADLLPYPKGSSKKYLLGPKYNMISEVYAGLPARNVSLNVEKIMITTGGTDNHNLTETLIHWIRGVKAFDQIELHVVIGAGFKNKDALLALNSRNIVLYENLNDLSSLMKKADLAISSSGSTLYELCASGVPTLSIIIVDNQVEIADQMDKSGLVRCVGWFNKLEKDKFVNELKSLCDDYDMRKIMVNRQQLLLDGNGAWRIVNEIRDILNAFKIEKGDSNA